MNKETIIQSAFVNFFKIQYPKYLINADVGGVWCKNIVQALKNKRLGHSNGFPDIFIPEPFGIYHGLFIEFKADKNKPTPDQKKWLKKLSDRYYKTAVCYTVEEAIVEVEKYLT